jgi:23S rRNA (uracil1939-C5)-methyltransferase
MRARLHVQHGRIGFYREGTHEICDATPTAQFLPATHAWIAAAEETLRRHRLTGLADLDLAENIAGDRRACHLELLAGTDASPFAALADGLVGLSAQGSDRPTVERLAGTPVIIDHLNVGGDGQAVLRIRRDVRAFFQGNRFLLERLVRHVLTLVPPGPVVDLYAGVGLFGLSLAAAGADAVTLVEGDPVSAEDLQENAEPFADRVRVERRSVEAYVAGLQSKTRRASSETYIVDPPRTGMTKQALAGILRAEPSRIIYVSCDVATLARDTRTLLDAGYGLGHVTGIDLFPNTAHVESVALFTR